MFGHKNKKFKKITYQYFGLVDSNTTRLLILDTNFENINLLREIVPNTTMANVSVKSILDRIIYKLLRPGTFHYMKWCVVPGTLEVSLEGRNAYRAWSLLVVAKYRTLSLIIDRISSLRFRMNKNILLQDIVYVEKASEAERFKDRGYPEHEILEYPFVLQYADYAKISPQESADRILLKASMRYELLARTESLRITYFNAVAEANTREELGKVYRDFLLDYDIKL